MQRVKKIIYIVVQIQAVEKKDCWKQNNQKHLYQGTYEHESSSQRWVTLGESRQVKLLFHCAPTADFKSIALGNCTAENISLWLKTQDIASVFSPWAEQQLSQKKEKKITQFAVYLQWNPIRHCIFYSKCSVSVSYQTGKGIAWTFLCLLSRLSNRWTYQRVWESRWKQITYHLPTNLLVAWLWSQALETTSGMRWVSVNQHDSYLPNPPVSGKPGVIGTLWLQATDLHNHKVFLLSSKDVPASPVSFFSYFNLFQLMKWIWNGALSSLWMLQRWEKGGGLHTSPQFCISLSLRSSHPCGSIIGEIKGQETSCIFTFTTWLNPSVKLWE